MRILGCVKGIKEHNYKYEIKQNILKIVIRIFDEIAAQTERNEHPVKFPENNRFLLFHHNAFMDDYILVYFISI